MTDYSRRRFAGLVAAGAAGAVVAGSTAQPAEAATAGLSPLPPKAPVLIFGDSYVEGLGADVKTNGWAYKVGPLLGWTVTVNGKGGTGYCNPTSYGAGVYFDRLLKVADAYDLVVLQGSSNDDKTSNGQLVYDDATLTAAINKLLDFARSHFTKAQLLMVGPTNPYGSVSVRANNLLVQAAAAHAIPFVNPIAEKWFVPGDGTIFANTSNGHPNNAGHAHMRSLFVRDLQVLMQ